MRDEIWYNLGLTPSRPKVASQMAAMFETFAAERDDQFSTRIHNLSGGQTRQGPAPSSK